MTSGPCHVRPGAAKAPSPVYLVRAYPPQYIRQGEESRVVHIGARNIKPLHSGSILFELSTPRRALFAIFKSYLKKTEPFRPPPISCQVATANAPAPVSRPSQRCDSNDHHESRIDVAVSPPIRIQTPSTSHQSTALYGFEPASERNSLDYRNLPDPPTSGVMVSSVCCKLACPAVPNSQCKKQGYLRAFNIQYRLDAFSLS